MCHRKKGCLIVYYVSEEAKRLHKAALNDLLQVFLCCMLLFLFSKYLGVEFLCLLFNFIRNGQLSILLPHQHCMRVSVVPHSCQRLLVFSILANLRAE